MRTMRMMMAVLLLSGWACAAEEAVLSDADTDKALEEIFAAAKKVTRASALMVTKIEGGFAKKTLLQYEEVKFAAPSRIWKLSREDSEQPIPAAQCSLVVFDGKYLWELQPEFEPGEAREGTRRTLNKEAKSVNGNAGMAVFLLRADVASVKELREEFLSIRCVREKDPAGKEALHFTLVGKKESITIDMWFTQGEAIPYKVRTEQKKQVVKLGAPKGSEPIYRTQIEERELRNTETNLSGLAPFPVETFLFPYAKGMVVEDDEVGVPIPAAEISRDLAERKQAMLEENVKRAKEE